MLPPQSCGAAWPLGQATAHRPAPGLGLDWRQKTARSARRGAIGNTFEDFRAIQGIAPHLARYGFDDRLQEPGKQATPTAPAPSLRSGCGRGFLRPQSRTEQAPGGSNGSRLDDAAAGGSTNRSDMDFFWLYSSICRESRPSPRIRKYRPKAKAYSAPLRARSNCYPEGEGIIMR